MSRRDQAARSPDDPRLIHVRVFGGGRLVRIGTSSNTHSFVRRIAEEASATSPADSPIRSVVRQMMPGREFAPGAHVHPGGVCDTHAVLCTVARETVARRLQAVTSFGRCA